MHRGAIIVRLARADGTERSVNRESTLRGEDAYVYLFDNRRIQSHCRIACGFAVSAAESAKRSE